MIPEVAEFVFGWVWSLWETWGWKLILFPILGIIIYFYYNIGGG